MQNTIDKAHSLAVGQAVNKSQSAFKMYTEHLNSSIEIYVERKWHFKYCMFKNLMLHCMLWSFFARKRLRTLKKVECKSVAKSRSVCIVWYWHEMQSRSNAACRVRGYAAISAARRFIQIISAGVGPGPPHMHRDAPATPGQTQTTRLRDLDVDTFLMHTRRYLSMRNKNTNASIHTHHCSFSPIYSKHHVFSMN